MQKKSTIKSNNTEERKASKTSLSKFPIVGIGASAGGLEALENFFLIMPEKTGMAFVVIQHLDPSKPGMMPELLQRMTQMKVVQAIDQLVVKPNNVYVIPPNKSLSILNGSLHTFEPTESRGLNLPIDIFLKSLAEDRQENSIGIILSGLGSDGSTGLKAIQEKDGITMVQEPTTAKFDAMPKSAIEKASNAIVLPAKELPKKLIKLLKTTPSAKPEKQIDFESKSNLDKIIILLRDHTGFDFTFYKKNTMFRRIDRRKEVHQIHKIQKYVRYLQDNPCELEILFKELLIGVTEFFRDKLVWEKLEKNILPEFIEQLPENYEIRAWIPACSTGEEAYSLAILFKEVLEKMKQRKNISLQIFATDIDNDSIEKARKGIFNANIASKLSAERLNRYFTYVGEDYQVNNSIREMIIFAPQNLIKDPPFTNLDIISCRNLLIYLEPELQKSLISLFNYSLNPNGLMLLGSAETPGSMKHVFKELDAKNKIYQHASNINISEISELTGSFPHNTASRKLKIASPKVSDNTQSIIENILLKHYTPASVLVNEMGDIIYITGRTGKYLEPVAGKANWNIHAMAREGLRHELPAAFRKAKQHPNPVVLKNIEIGSNGHIQLTNVTIQHIGKPDAVKGMLIIVFTDVEILVEPGETPSKNVKQISSNKQKKIEQELQRAQEELQTTREEMQTSKEELTSTNEELQSTIEELQSTNEELTTSKEEMQSLNEELQTVNIELQSKVCDLEQASSDMKNLLNSTEIATLFIDKNLNIRRFTDSMTNIFKLRNNDIGRPFTDLVSDLNYTNIQKDAIKVLKTLSTLETAVTSKKERWFNVRIMPYRTLDDRIDGLVITFSDITEHKKLEIALKKNNEEKKNK